MSWWTLTFRFVQIFYLIGAMVAILLYSGIIFFKKIELDGEELYKDYVEQYRKYHDEGDEPAYSQNEIVLASALLKVVVVAALPVAFLIYRSRLTTLPAFKLLKLHQRGR